MGVCDKKVNKRCTNANCDDLVILLMMHKKEPRTAFEKVEAWVESELQEKEKKPVAVTNERKDKEAKAGAEVNGD